MKKPVINREEEAMKQIDEAMEKLQAEVTPSDGMSSSTLRNRAKDIACIGLEHYKDELLDRCLGISAAIVAFAEELENPS